MFGRSALLALCSLSSNRKSPACVSRGIPRVFTNTALGTFHSSAPLFVGEKIPVEYNKCTAAMFPSRKDALRHVSESAKTNAEKLVKCGNLACQHDSLLQTLSSAKIVSYASFEFEEKKPGKKKGKNKGEPCQSAQVVTKASGCNTPPIVYAITLSDSIFFPEGGGQFADHGTLRLTSKNGVDSCDEEGRIELFVQDAQNVDDICVLLCCLPAESGSTPEDLAMMLKHSDVTVDQTLDWERRYDQMTQHSGQHLCSAVALSDFDVGTHSFSLGEKISYIDFAVEESWNRDHASNVFAEIEKKVNAHIRDNIPMKPQWLEKNDPLFESKVRSRLLPDGLEGPIRIVEIGNGIDLNTCCGTHVPVLGHLQMIKFFRMEKVKPTIFRVYFAAAKRLTLIMDDMYDTQAKLTKILACTEAEQVMRLRQLLDDKRDRDRKIETLNDKLSTCHSKEIIEECRARRVNFSVVDLGDVDIGYMTLVSTKVLDGFGNEKPTLLFVGGEDGSDEGSFLLLGNKVIVDKVGKEVANMFDGRGGGKNGKFQGKGLRVRSSLELVKQFLLSTM
mmetsp:Transcript_20137/g.30282  ORF Transcript_20137/g.30282 Transcript_20137/m.30282 type:complete len:560 (-) Transcript_20137:136-1815(-)